MSTLRFRLFGKFSVERNSQSVKGLDASKEQELLSYLLVRRNQCHPRETLANMLWGDSSTERSKKYLRQALWRLQLALEPEDGKSQQVVQVEHDWVQLNSRCEVWLDVAILEKAFVTAQGVPGDRLDRSSAQLLKDAVEVYRGDLLDGWYQDWCLFERERLQNIYLSMLDKLMSYSEHHLEYETGVAYGAAILRFDRARERTHRQLMHLQCMAGDRTGALRQYERCVAALEEELGVKPEGRTTTLYEQIRADRLDSSVPVTPQSASGSTAQLPQVLSRLKRLQVILAGVQRRVQRDIKAVEQGLKTTER